MRKISVLGAGWLGTALVKELLRRGGFSVMASTSNQLRKQELLDFNVANLARKEPSSEGSELALYSIRVPDVLLEEHAFFQTDVLVITLPPGRNREHAEERYRTEISSILALAKAQNCGAIIYTSSTGVYGNASGRVTETTPTSPTTASALAVVAAEKLIGQSGIPATILRLAGLFGLDRHPGRWFGGKAELPDADAPVNLVHQTDVAKAIIAVLEQAAWNTTYNVCATNHPSRGDYYPHAAAELGLGVPLLLPGGGDGKWIDSSKIKAELRWYAEL